MVDRGYTSTAIADRVKPPKLRSREPNFLTDKEYKALLFEAQRQGRRRDYAMLQLLVQTGLRVGELVRLRLGDIDWTVPQLLVKGRKNGVDTNVPLERQLVGFAFLELDCHGRIPEVAEVETAIVQREVT